MEKFIKLTIFAAFITLASCQQSVNGTLMCYNCDPINNGIDECTYPEKNLAPTTKCEPKVNETAVCVSSFLNHTDKAKVGIYRDCVLKPIEVANVCDWIKETKTSQNATFKSCHSCNTSSCNSVLLYSDGSSSATNIYNLQTLTFVNVLMVAIFLFWK